MKWTAIAALSMAVALAPCVSADAATVYVDSSNTAGPWDGTLANPFSRIQDGIDAAVDGDTVLVRDGTYKGQGNMDLDFEGRTIVVMSENGPENTIIDCENEGSGFYFHNGEDSASVVKGFTIKNGTVSSGGGAIACRYSSPTITHNIFSSNWAQYGNGGAIACQGSSPTTPDYRITLSGVSRWVPRGTCGLGRMMEGWSSSMGRTGRDIPHLTPDCRITLSGVLW